MAEKREEDGGEFVDFGKDSLLSVVDDELIPLLKRMETLPIPNGRVSGILVHWGDFRDNAVKVEAKKAGGYTMELEVSDVRGKVDFTVWRSVFRDREDD